MKRILKIIKILKKKYKIKPFRGEPFKVLIGTVLSQRTKDELTWPTNEKLFRVADVPKKFLKLSEKQIAKLIYPVGFYNQKAKRIKQISKILLEKYKGKIPRTREELMNLPEVGPKTADIVLSYGYGIPSIAIDTHCNRVSKRIGIVPENATLEEVKSILESLLSRKEWNLINHLFVTFGKDICRPRKPLCYKCPVVRLCPYEFKNL